MKMPHINRIRVNNVKYNFGTQFYDDFVMRFDGKNALYDLANGGGKSVLMLLLFQNLIPNCTLDDKQPVEKLFRTNEGSSSIHSLIEWKLDDCDIEDGYRYMLTGFCARKAKDDAEGESGDAASIDYYNYVIFYQNYNDNDLVNLPLSRGKERMTYVGLRSYLKELEHKDYSLKVHIFDRKGEYQRFISRYGLYESQWEIIRGINKTEGHVRTYFESTYRTTRRVVEDLFIEEIIQKAFIEKTGEVQEDMAGTLLSIRSKLSELSKKRQEIASYDRQIQALESFESRIDSLSKLYRSEDDFKEDLVKTYHGLQHAIRLKDHDMETSKKEQLQIQKRVEEIERKLDTVKVQKNQETLGQMEQDAAQLDEKVQTLEAQYGRSQMALARAESLRDYAEYLECKKEAEILREVIKNAGSGDTELKSRLSFMAGQAKGMIKKEQSAVSQALNQAQEDCRRVEDDIKQNETRLRQLDLELAVLENDQNRSQEQEKELIHTMSALRQSVNVLLIEGTQKELKTYRQREAQLEKTMEALNERRGQLQTQSSELHDCLEILRSQTAELKYRKEQYDHFFESIEKQRPKADHLLTVYGAENYGQLKDLIYRRYQKAAADMYLLGLRQKEKKVLLEELSKHNSLVAGEAVTSVMDYLKRCHQCTCISGSDYLKDIENEEKEKLLKHLPFLPYAVIVRSGFSEIAADRMLHEKDFGPGQVPIIRFERVLSGEPLYDVSDLLLTGRDTPYFVDEEQIESLAQNTKRQLEQMEGELARLQDQEMTYREDLAWLHHFVDDFDARQTDMLAQSDACSRQLEENARQETELIAQQDGILRDLETLEQEEKTVSSELKTARQETEVVGQICEQNEKLESLRGSLKLWQQETAHKKQQRSETGEQLDLLEEERLQTSGRRASLAERLEHLLQMWDDLFAPYDEGGSDDVTEPQGNEVSQEERENTENTENSENTENIGNTEAFEAVGMIENPQTLESLEIEFTGLCKAYEADRSDMADKQKLLENYEKTMQRLTLAIESRHMTMEELSDIDADHLLQAPEADDILKLRDDLAQLKKEIDLQKGMAQDARGSWHRLTGRVENAIAVIEEKYGEYQAVDLKNMDYDIFESEYRQSLTQFKEKLEAIARGIETGERELRQFDDMRKDLDRLMRNTGVGANAGKAAVRPDENFRKLTKDLFERYEQLRRDEDLKKAEFERNRDQLADTLRLLKADELADEIRYQITLPTTGVEAGQMYADLKETIRIVMLEKDRVYRGIEDMVKIKSYFEKQCLQRCSDIRMELSRLPKMSVISLDGQEIQMVDLKIPYVKEEFYEQRMSEYIDRIVENADALGSEDERLKYLRRQLSWKNLFSVIVTDMDKIKLSLYKRERIREQSRFLKYEEAVGSTGQSQGIYIQFLIAVINYISAINSRNDQPAALKKVIFIDNPFGAAKDIYIWEPIFALLKANNVQLIVPARGATPAITGKFDVNYVLGQKLVGTRQQTVVVDFSSNVKIEEMEYRHIEYEQEVFDFV